MKIGILREEKVPQDSRVPLAPKQCVAILSEHPGIEIFVQPSPHRCYSDVEFRQAGITLREDLSSCDVILGVKEVPIPNLIADKTYLFFSHTIKEQPYNRSLLQEIIKKKIRLIDYECIVDEKGMRVIAFGKWAGIVGAHNGLWVYGQRTGAYSMQRAFRSHDYEDLKKSYTSIKVPNIKIVVSGGGRVSQGAVETLENLSIARVSKNDFLSKSYTHPVYTQLDVEDLYQRKHDGGFDLQEFFDDPSGYESLFASYAKGTDLFINGIYWNPAAPLFFKKEDVKSSDFRIQTIADISCDIEGSVPITLRSTTIEEPVFGYSRLSGEETVPFSSESIDIMAVDNLPNELPRDASKSFGEVLSEKVISELLATNSSILNQATIAVDGALNSPYDYLQDFVGEASQGSKVRD